MITFTQGNLLEARAEALVNTVNTVGVMGKGIALMFKERLTRTSAVTPPPARPGSTDRQDVRHAGAELDGPRWIVNFPTKQHWRAPSRMEWVVEGLQDLRRFDRATGQVHRHPAAGRGQWRPGMGRGARTD
jgi:hypothetical protein